LCHSKKRKRKRKRKCCRGLSKQQSLIKLTPLKERFKYLKLSNYLIIWLEWSFGPLVRLLKPWQKLKNLWRSKLTFPWKILFALCTYLWIIYILR
jgi:hypothetical protein